MVSSIFLAVVCAATVVSPKLFTANCRQMEPMDTMENINAIESPFPNKSFIISLFSLKSSFPGRRSLHFVIRYTEHMMQENTWDKTVASPAPNTPK